MKKNHIIILSLLLVLTAGIITTNYANQLGALFAEGAAPNPGHALGEIEGGNDLATKTYVNNALSGISGSKWIVSGSNIYRSSGNVGIGTVSPTVKLDVVGVIRGTGVVTNRSGETRPTCNSSTKGMQWYDYTDNLFLGCNGTSWHYLSPPPSCASIAQGGEWIDSGLGFCVMKYEARKAAGDIASSNPTDPVWASINQASARAACQAIGADLITNDQWTALARNIENTASNWSNGAVGNGVLARGWAAVSYGDSWTNSRVAYETGPSCLYNTGANACGSTGTHLYKRTHTLSNGETIWDLSGNVWEWNSDTCSQTNWYKIDGWIEWNNSDLSDYEKPNAGPSGNYTSTDGAGRYYGCTRNGNGFFRGGAWNNGADAGVFALRLSYWPASAGTDIGFRCTVTP